MLAYLLEIRHGGGLFGGPSNSVDVRYGAIPYELTHLGKHCQLVSVHTFAGVGESVACQGPHGGAPLGQPEVGSPGAQPATWETVFTAMFLHGSFLHIFGNMVFLGIFGPTVEDTMSRPAYLGFYLLGGIVALSAQVAVDPSATGPTLGASGAIAAVLGGYILLYPRARILTLVFIVFLVTIVEVPAVFLLGFWFAEQVWLGLSGLSGASGIGGDSAGVAYFAHVGGFAFGLLVIRLLARRRTTPPRPVY